jgi:hypothetical protein
MKFEKLVSLDWQQVAGAVTLELSTAVKTPGVLASPHARLVLRGDSTVRLQSDATDPSRPLRPGDVAAVFLMEHRIAVEKWLSAIAASVACSELQQVAAVVVRALRSNATRNASAGFV